MPCSLDLTEGRKHSDQLCCMTSYDTVTWCMFEFYMLRRWGNVLLSFGVCVDRI